MSVDVTARSSLGTAAARQLATISKSVPRTRESSPRWLLRMLPWVDVPGATYRVNQRRVQVPGGGPITVRRNGSGTGIDPAELVRLPVLHGYRDGAVLADLAGRFVRQEFRAGEVIAELGRPADRLYVIEHGKAQRQGKGEYGEPTVLGWLADGDYFGEQSLARPGQDWPYRVRALTAGTMLVLPGPAFRELVDGSDTLRAQLRRFRAAAREPANRRGEAEIALAAGHRGEPDLPGTFAAYHDQPRELRLSVAQTVLRVHTRVTDLYNDPMDQLDQQLRLTVEALRERQEREIVTNPEFGLLASVDHGQRIPTRSGPATPDDLDDLLSRRRKTRLLVAHPRAIAAFGRECNRRGVSPQTVELDGRQVSAWRGVPLLPCDKIPVSRANTSSILAMRTGEADEGVVGLRQTGIPDEREPGLSVRFTGVSRQAVASYLVSAYFAAAVLVPDALGVLARVELGR